MNKKIVLTLSLVFTFLVASTSSNAAIFQNNNYFSQVIDKVAKLYKSYYGVLSNSKAKHLVYVDSSKQKLYLLKKSSSSKYDILTKEYDVSTSRFGIGNIFGTKKTPPGLHKVSEKIGHNVPLGGVFKQRRYTKRILPINSSYAKGKDGIITRIIWLEGLEHGINKGFNKKKQNVDTKSRGIYIHGTRFENSVGKPASIGCIHLRNKELVELFKIIEKDTLIYIN